MAQMSLSFSETSKNLNDNIFLLHLFGVCVCVCVVEEEEIETDRQTDRDLRMSSDSLWGELVVFIHRQGPKDQT